MNIFRNYTIQSLIIMMMGLMMFSAVVYKAQAQTQTTDTSSDISSLVQIVSTLQAQVEELRDRIEALSIARRGFTPEMSMPETAAAPPIDRNLSFGDQGEDVRVLQQILNQDPNFQVTKPGEETTYFGPATRDALKRFQERHRESILRPLGRSEGTGIFAERTRALLKEKIKNGFVLPIRPQGLLPSQYKTPEGYAVFSNLPQRGVTEDAIPNELPEVAGCVYAQKQYVEGQEIQTTKAQLENNELITIEEPRTFVCRNGQWQFDGNQNEEEMTKEYPLVGTEWNWRELLDEDDDVVSTLPADNPFVITFNEDMTFSSKTDCNGVGGEYETNGEDIALSDMFSTLMYCEGSQESEYRSLLQDVDTYVIEGNTLYLISSDNDETMVFRPVE